jgi:anti-anti-sigma factor
MSVDPADREVFADGPLFVGRRRYGSEVLVVSLAGELDQSNVGSARRAIAEFTAGSEDEILVIDLSALEFIDSSGIALLFSLVDFGGDGSNLRIVPSEAPAVSRVLKLTGIEEKVRIAQEHPARVV